MFERNKIDNADNGLVSVELTLSDDRSLTGKISMPPGRGFLDVLNSAALYVEFESFDGERCYLAKMAIKALKPLGVQRGVNLGQKLRDLDGFDPHAVLGIPKGASWDETRAAFHRQAKVYHPDRFATADLPEEVRNYISGMSQRLNAAHAALEAMHSERKLTASRRQAPIYTSAGRPFGMRQSDAPT
jgi:DnaJ-domain-containing protein 1